MDIVKYCGDALELILLYRNADEGPRFFLVKCALSCIKSFEILCKNMHWSKYEYVAFEIQCNKYVYRLTKNMRILKISHFV